MKLIIFMGLDIWSEKNWSSLRAKTMDLKDKTIEQAAEELSK